jgi:hypothetical protein
MLLVFLLASFCVGLRRPSCAGVIRNVSRSDVELFRFAFANFEEAPNGRSGKDFLNFEFLIGAAMDLVDKAAMLVAARQAELLVNPINVSAASALLTISDLFAQRAQTGGLSASAAWLTMAFRFNQEKLEYFQQQYNLLEAVTGCSLVSVGGKLFGLYCPGSDAGAPRVIAQTGFDGSLLTIYTEVCQSVVDSGWSCLALTGPGQGESALLGNTTFQTDWTSVVSAGISFLSSMGDNGGPIVLWCRSFGGHLCARAAGTPGLAALVLDGGVIDMYQNVSGEVLFFVVFKNAYLQRCFVACLRFCKMISTTIAQSSIRLCNMLPHSLCPSYLF